MKNKHLARLFFVLTFIFLSSGAYLLLPDQNPIQKPKSLIQNLPWTNTVTNTTISDNKKIENETAQKTSITPQTQKKEIVLTTSTVTDSQKIEIGIEISGQTYQIKVAEKSTVYDAIQKLIENKQITATLKEYSGMGKFVEEINGVASDSQSGKYWIYYINGQPAKTGISNYILKQNDKITWKYEHSKF